ncbi:thiol reductant ABC exporter subunit CydC [Saccharibacillus sp. O16]|nr:thiol reductant ABC exporter subunit CydC [Saccharibacillus sp. O16]
MSELSIFTRAMLKERKDILLSILGGFFAGIAGVVLFSTSGYLIAKTVFAPPLYTLIILTSLVKILGLARAGSRYGERLFSHRATFSLLSRLRTTFFAKLVPLAPRMLDKQRSGDLLARIVGDIEGLQFYFLRVAYPPIIVVSVFLATVLFASFFSIWIALLLVVGMLITAFVVPAIVQIGQRKADGRVRRKRAAFSTEATEMMQGFIDLKVYGRLEQRQNELLTLSDELTDAQQSDAHRLLRGQSLHSFVTFFVSWGVLVLGTYLIVSGSLAGVFLAMLIMASMTVFDESAAMATLPTYKKDSQFAARRLAETFEAAPPVVEPAGTLDDSAPPSIELRQVSLRYEEAWRPVLSGVSLRLPAGAKTAIVGASGSGKSSLLELLLKLQTPTLGQVMLGSTPIEELNAEDLWHKSRVVLQQGHFFKGTLRDNLLVDDAAYTDSELLEVLEQVDLPGRKLDELMLEKGENLSDGEKQRLAIARTLLKKGRLWLLDEPTSSLDYVTERRILKLLLERAQGDTLVLVSHRLAGLQQMDVIVVMDHGEIVEAGSYNDLMARKGYFYEMKQLERQMIGEENQEERQRRLG